MKHTPRNKKILIALLVLLIFSATYQAWDVAGGSTPVMSFLVPTGAFLLFSIYMVLKQLFSK